MRLQTEQKESHLYGLDGSHKHLLHLECYRGSKIGTHRNHTKQMGGHFKATGIWRKLVTRGQNIDLKKFTNKFAF